MKTVPRLRRQNSLIHGRPYTVAHLVEYLEHYWDYRKKGRYHLFRKAAFQFFEDVHSGRRFSDEDLTQHPYYEYLKATYKEHRRNDPVVHKRCLELMREGIVLYQDIKDYGMKAPLDMWRARGKLNLYRGQRRLVIAHVLGRKNVAVRVFKDSNVLIAMLPSRSITLGNSIEGLGVKQFMEMGPNATDKYWIHGYLRLYDVHLAHLRDSAEAVLELGVKKGASLSLWRDAFPNARIYGVDKDISQARIARRRRNTTLLEGLQEDEQFLRESVVPNGKFDLIIDDAGHRGTQQQASFRILWDALASGGFYVIEDLYGNYWQDKRTKTMIHVLKDLVDDVNLGKEVKSLHFYYNICFIEKR